MENVKVSVSYEKLLRFRANAQAYVRAHLKEKMNKFSYALTKMISRTNELEVKYNDQVSDIRIDLASVDDKGNLISKEITGSFGQTFTKYEFTPKNSKELNKKIRDLNNEEVEVEPYICTGDIPEDVNMSLQEEFTPFVLKEVSQQEPDK